MYYRINNTLIFNFKVKFLTTLTQQCLFRRFSRLYLAAHKLPQPTLRFMSGSLPNKIAITITYDGSDNINYILRNTH